VPRIASVRAVLQILTDATLQPNHRELVYAQFRLVGTRLTVSLPHGGPNIHSFGSKQRHIRCLHDPVFLEGIGTRASGNDVLPHEIFGGNFLKRGIEDVDRGISRDDADAV